MKILSVDLKVLFDPGDGGDAKNVRVEIVDGKVRNSGPDAMIDGLWDQIVERIGILLGGIDLYMVGDVDTLGQRTQIRMPMDQAFLVAKEESRRGRLRYVYRVKDGVCAIRVVCFNRGEMVG